MPSGWATYTGSNSPELGADAGRAVAVFWDATTSAPIVAYSSDGGITWASPGALTSGISSSAARLTRPVRDPNSGAWFFVASSTTVAEVWKSTTGGATWAIVKTFTAGTDVEVQGAAMIGPVWAMCTTKGRILASKDQGVSWRWISDVGDGTASSWGLGAGGGGAVALNSSDKTSFRSTRAGLTAGPII